MDYLLKLQQLARPYQTDFDVQVRLAEIKRCVQEIGQGQLLSRPLPILQLEQNCWLDFLAVGLQQSIPAEQIEQDFQTLNYLFGNFRKYLQYHFGQWTLISQQALTIWTKYWPQKSYLEVMAGNGVLARGLVAHGQTVIATDSFAWQAENKTGRELHYPVQDADALTAIAKYGRQVDAVLLSWSPDHDPIDVLIAQQIRQLPNHPDLIVIGEKFGVTNSQLFWQTQAVAFSPQVRLINRYLPQHDLVKEQVFLIR
ncbi:hypothetical protein [Lapidilactobacillus bayanensis]|uniref:hypothetical protein n=1 Tax=Lapidilactobacillus bayanensis TaxID=2485998 RepID=UPI000F7A35AE|nr:hypothetical protein [Lapidilactobacillus bayanensis]